MSFFFLLGGGGSSVTRGRSGSVGSGRGGRSLGRLLAADHERSANDQQTAQSNQSLHGVSFFEYQQKSPTERFREPELALDHGSEIDHLLVRPHAACRRTVNPDGRIPISLLQLPPLRHSFFTTIPQPTGTAKPPLLNSFAY